jgi:hypothetical protein
LLLLVGLNVFHIELLALLNFFLATLHFGQGYLKRFFGLLKLQGTFGGIVQLDLDGQQVVGKLFVLSQEIFLISELELLVLRLGSFVGHI